MRPIPVHIHRLALIVSVLAMPCGAALASDAPSWLTVDVPADWSRSTERSDAIAERATALEPLGTDTDVGVDSYTNPPGTAALHVMWFGGPGPEDDPAELARRQLDEVRTTPEASRTARVVSWDEQLAEGIARGRLEWRHERDETVTLVRTMVWLTDDGAPRRADAECVMRAEAETEARSACEAALASLQVRAPADGRTPIPALPEPSPRPAAQAVGDDDASSSPSTASLQPAREGVSRDSAVILQREPEDEDRSSRWLYLGGIVLLIIAFYLTTRSRTRDRDEAHVHDGENVDTDGVGARADEHDEDDEHDPDADDEDRERDPDDEERS